MASDYEAIRRSSQEKYGTDISNYGPTLLANLYSTRTHFILELLQNAEDAQATEINFELFPDRLEVSHDGIPFAESDVVSICSIARSSKKDNLTQIGKFGIGFKAVYAYTHSPAIHSGDESFVIESFVHPRPVLPRERRPDETLFIFPFDHPDVPPEQAFAEIASGLRVFECEALLFLRSLERMGVSIASDLRYRFQRELRPTRESEPREDFRQVILKTVVTQKGVSRESIGEWLRIEDCGKRDETDYRVSVAFRLSREGQSVRIQKCNNPPVYVYFPTEKYYPTGFLIQGPFRTTPSRDNIPADDEWNRFLAKAIAKLARKAFLDFAKNGMLDVQALECLPVTPNANSLYAPIYDELLAMAKTEAIFPVDGGGYARAGQCLVPRGEELRKLFSTENLRLLMKRSDVHWTAAGITSDYLLARYWKENQILRVVEPHDLMSYLTKAFFQQQPDAWMSRFYHFLSEHRALRPSLRGKPILRTESNDHINALDSLGRAAAFLPGEAKTDFPTLKKCFADDPQIRQMFSQLGLKEPGAVDILERFVLPQYQEKQIRVTQKENLNHLKLILSVLGKDRRILPLVQQYPIVRCETGGNLLWEVPGKAYIRNKTLEDFFGDDFECAYLSKVYTKQDSDQFELLGCSKSIRVSARTPGAHNYVKIRAEHGFHERGVDGFDPDFQIDGLEHVLDNPTFQRAQILWNEILLNHANRIEGVLERSSVQSFPLARTKRTTIHSSAGLLLQTKAWLPDKNGQFHKPCELSLEDLPDGFVRSEILAQKLKLKVSAVANLAREQGVDPMILEFALKNPDMIRELQKKQAKDLLDASVKAKQEINYAKELEEKLSQPQRAQQGSCEGPQIVGAVRNADIRRQRLGEELREAKSQEPDPEQRFARISSRLYEGADDAVRGELRVWYQGQCQICQDTFSKRDGAPYFEAVHLVPRSEARWLNTSGNLLCLCANCAARFRHGVTQCDDLLDQIRAYRALSEGGDQAHIKITLCGEKKIIKYQEKHLLALQVLVSESGSPAHVE